MVVSPADMAACRQMIRDGSKTFFMASLLLPDRVRGPARSLYAFCRVADDAVDQSHDCHAAVRDLHARLDDIYRGHPQTHVADRAFADVARRYSLPRAIPEALIEGFAWDAGGRRYDSLSDVIAYGVRVAGTVGVMMSIIMGSREQAAIARACDLGVAMQLTNIARDVGEDARNGRLYIPRDWFAEHGLDADRWLASPRHSPELAAMIGRLLAEADRLYDRATTGIDLLPPACRPAIHASRLLYAEIGREVERAAHDSVAQRAVVSTGRKSLLMCAALVSSMARRSQPAPEILPEASFLAQAVAASPPPEARPRGFDARAKWLAELFMRLEKQSQ
jgi:phytoene synthase